MTAQHEDSKKPDHTVQIKIDHEHYRVPKGSITEAQLRALPEPDIAVDRDIWEDRPGDRDRKILPGESVEVRNGQRFFTAPGQINPGTSAKQA